MEKNRKQKKLFLFISDANPLWSTVRDAERTANLCVGLAYEQVHSKAMVVRMLREPTYSEHKLPSHRWELLGISDETFRLWEKNEIAQNNSGEESMQLLVEGLAALTDHLRGLYEEAATPALKAKLDTALRGLSKSSDRINSFLADYRSDEEAELGVYDAGWRLGISVEQSQKTIDKLFYTDRPLLGGPYYDSEIATRSDYDKLGGIYRLWIRREKGWLKCAVHVRYAIPMGNGKKKSPYVIRTKLNLPMLYPTHEAVQHAKKMKREWPYWEYDGFVHPLKKKIYWFFEKRDSMREDYFTFITGDKVSSQKLRLDENSKGFTGFLGTYLTTHQDELQSIVTDAVILELVSGVSEDHFSEAINFMWREPVPIAANDPKTSLLNSLYSRLSKISQ